MHPRGRSGAVVRSGDDVEELEEEEEVVVEEVVVALFSLFSQ